MCKCSQENCELEVFENNNKCVFHLDEDIYHKNDHRFKIRVWTEIKKNSNYGKFPKYAKLFGTNISIKNGFWLLRREYLITGDMGLRIVDSDSDKIIINIENTTISGNLDIYIPHDMKDKFNKKIFVYFTNVTVTGGLYFSGKINIYEIKFKENCKIHNFTLGLESSIEDFMYIDKTCQFGKIDFRNSVFNGLLRCALNVDNIDLSGTVFKGKIDFYDNSKIKEITFKNTKFENMVNFKNIQFKDEVNFQNTSFEEKVWFENTYLNNKINLENCIFQKDINFLGLKSKDKSKPIKVANRETARIIKDSFEQQNNIIEANKFYALEMKEREEELKQDREEGKNFFEWLVFKIHGLSSNHSQDWVLSLFWILSFSFGYSFMSCVNKLLDTKLEYILTDTFIYLFVIYTSILIINYKKMNKFFLTGLFYIFYVYLSKDFTLQTFSNNLNPFSIMTEFSELNFSTMIYKITIAYLIYQLIISIRQNTRRK